MGKDQILAALPKLSKPELEAIHAVVSSLIGGHTGVGSAALGEAPQALIDALQATAGAAMPYASLPPTLQKQFMKRAAALIDFFNTEFYGWADSKITQQAFCRHVFGLLKIDLEWAGVGQSIGMMIKNLHRIPAIINDAYPDYVKCGMGYLILKQFKVKNVKLDKGNSLVKES